MSNIQYGKIRLDVPSLKDGDIATLSTIKGFSRNVTMHAPKTDIFLPGLEQYRVRGGFTDENVSLDFGEMKKVNIIGQKTMKNLALMPYFANQNSRSQFFDYEGELYQISNTGICKFKVNKWVSENTAFGSIRAQGFRHFYVLNGTLCRFDATSNGYGKYYRFENNTWTQVKTSSFYSDGTPIFLGCNGSYAFFGAYDYNSSSTTGKYMIYLIRVSYDGTENTYLITRSYYTPQYFGAIDDNYVYIGARRFYTDGDASKYYDYIYRCPMNNLASPTVISSTITIGYSSDLFCFNGKLYNNNSDDIYVYGDYSGGNVSRTHVTTMPGFAYNNFVLTNHKWNDGVNDYMLLIGKSKYNSPGYSTSQDVYLFDGQTVVAAES